MIRNSGKHSWWSSPFPTSRTTIPQWPQIELHSQSQWFWYCSTMLGDLFNLDDDSSSSSVNAPLSGKTSNKVRVNFVFSCIVLLLNETLILFIILTHIQMFRHVIGFQTSSSSFSHWICGIGESVSLKSFPMCAPLNVCSKCFILVLWIRCICALCL